MPTGIGGAATNSPSPGLRVIVQITQQLHSSVRKTLPSRQLAKVGAPPHDEPVGDGRAAQAVRTARPAAASRRAAPAAAPVTLSPFKRLRVHHRQQWRTSTSASASRRSASNKIAPHASATYDPRADDRPPSSSWPHATSALPGGYLDEYVGRLNLVASSRSVAKGDRAARFGERPCANVSAASRS